jgi:hypothetical protein
MPKKRSRIAFLLIIVIIVIILLAVIVYANLGTQSNQFVAGVKAGDVFTYEMQGLWESDDPNATISDTILQLNMTEWFRVTITNVSNPDVSLHTVWRFKNGTEIEADGEMDLETGFSSGGFWAIYASNLDAGELTHPKGPDRVAVNDTITRNYPSGVRETNRLMLTAQFYNVNDPSRTYTDSRTVQFDKETGMLVELFNQNVYNSPEMTETIWWKLTDSNVWTVT